MSDLPLVSVLFITYNRLSLLSRTLSSFRVRTSYPNLQLVVADDGSPAEVQGEIRKLPFDDFVLARNNKGLGANANAGIAQCRGPYILMLQDDWDCVATSDYLGDTIRVMTRNPHIGLIKYYGPEHEVDRTLPLAGADRTCLPVATVNPDEQHPSNVYSDTPHVMSRAAIDHLGPYRENCPMELCELDYCRRFDRQHDFQAAIFPRYYNQCFVHTGGEESHRTGRARYRIDEALKPAASILRRFPPAFYLGRLAVRSSVRALECLRMIK